MLFMMFEFQMKQSPSITSLDNVFFDIYLEDVNIEMLEFNSSHIVDNEHNGLDQLRGNPAEAAERIEEVQKKTTAGKQH